MIDQRREDTILIATLEIAGPHKDYKMPPAWLGGEMLACLQGK